MTADCAVAEADDDGLRCSGGGEAARGCAAPCAGVRPCPCGWSGSGEGWKGGYGYYMG